MRILTSSTTRPSRGRVPVPMPAGLRTQQSEPSHGRSARRARNTMTDGLRLPVCMSSVAKSASAETMTRPSSRPRAKIISSSARVRPLPPLPADAGIPPICLADSAWCEFHGHLQQQLRLRFHEDTSGALFSIGECRSDRSPARSAYPTDELALSPLGVGFQARQFPLKPPSLTTRVHLIISLFM